MSMTDENIIKISGKYIRNILSKLQLGKEGTNIMIRIFANEGTNTMIRITI